MVKVFNIAIVIAQVIIYGFVALLCTLRACVIGLPIGVLIPWVINLMLRQSFPILYEILVMLIRIGVVSIFAVTVCITLVATQSVKKQNIIEVIHNESI